MKVGIEGLREELRALGHYGDGEADVEQTLDLVVKWVIGTRKFAIYALVHFLAVQNRVIRPSDGTMLIREDMRQGLTALAEAYVLAADSGRDGSYEELMLGMEEEDQRNVEMAIKDRIKEVAAATKDMD